MIVTHYLRTRLVTPEEFYAAYQRFGAVYFVKDDANDAVKIGYAQDAEGRLSTLQVGSSNRLRFIGIVAAAREIEKHVHQQFVDGRTQGEWFQDRGIITSWLLSMTQDEPMRRHVWQLVEAKQVFWSWDDIAKAHTKHIWNPKAQAWEPPLP